MTNHHTTFPERVEHRGVPVMTTEQLAKAYGVAEANVRMNLSRNPTRFEDGTHFFRLEGEELRKFKNSVTGSYAVKPNAKELVLWTQHGALRHAKLLESQKAWEVFGQLEETYFAVRAGKIASPPMQFDIPKTYADALQLAANQARELQVAAPKARFYDAFMDSDGLFGFRQGSRAFGMQPNELATILKKPKKEGGLGHLFYEGRRLTPYREYGEQGAGYYVTKTVLNERFGTSWPQTFITPKGMEHIADCLGLLVEA